MVHSMHEAALNVLDGAIKTLASSQTDQAVHAARKATKRTRAALRLMRDNLGTQVYWRENRRVRDAAKPLTAVRDAFVLRATLRNLPARSVALQRVLDAEYHRERTAVVTLGAQAFIARLRNIRQRLADMPPLNPEAASAVAGVHKSYKAGRRACSRARGRDDRMLHELRKQAKYLLNQLELLHEVFEVDFKKLHRRADRLAAILGDDHDLGMLYAKLRRHDASNQRLRKIIKKRRRDLQSKALRIAKKLYQHPAKRIRERVAARLNVP
jgi:CHAD domain-containing protein